MEFVRKEEHKVTEHGGYQIYLSVSGRFRTVIENENVFAPSLQAIKARIDNKLREKARQQAKTTPAIVLGMTRRYRYSDQEETEVEWLEGFFVGLDAVSGRIRFLEKGKKEPRTLDRGGYWFFRPKDPALKAVRNLVNAFLLAEKELNKSQESMKKLRGKAGFEPELPSYIGRDKERTRVAAEIEQKLMAHLQGKKEED